MLPSMMKNSDSKTIPGTLRRGPPLPPKPLFGFLLALTALVAIALISYLSLQATISASRNLTQSVEVLGQLNTVLSTLKDAETGQRGYLLTGDESYLEPYSSAVAALPGEFSTLRGLMANRPQLQKRLEALESIANQKINELRQTVDLRRAGQASAALAIVHTDRGKILMDRLRAAIGDMDAAERQLIGRRSDDWQSAAASSLAVTLGGSGVLLALITFAAIVASRDHRKGQLESWLRAGQMGLSEQLQGDQALAQLGHKVVDFLAARLDAHVGAVYIAEAGQFRRFGGYAIPAGADTAALRPGEGLLGQAAKEN